MKTEAQGLADRFKNVRNRAAFARDYGVPGGDSMIYQHMKGLKPISIEAAIAYAIGFKCSIEDISPSNAERLSKVPLHTIRTTLAAPVNTDFLARDNVADYLDPSTEEVVRLMKATDAKGRDMALGAVRGALHGYRPIEKSQAA